MRGAPPCKRQRPFLDYPHRWLSQHGSRPYGVLSAFLVSCRCRGKHTTLYFIPLAPHHPCCLLLKISYSHHCIWLPTNDSLNSVKNPFGELIFFIEKRCLGPSLCTYLNVWICTEEDMCMWKAYTPLRKAGCVSVNKLT